MNERIIHTPEGQTVLQKEQFAKLSLYKKLNFIVHGEAGLGEAIQGAITSFSKEFTEASLSKQPISETRSYIIHLVGAPGAGKSYIRRMVESYVRTTTSTLQQSEAPIQIASLGWDRVEEELIRKRIITPNDIMQPFEDEELAVINGFFNTLLRYHLGKKPEFSLEMLYTQLDNNPIFRPQQGETISEFKRRVSYVFSDLISTFQLGYPSNPSILVVEQPGATALKKSNGEWQDPYRDYSSRTIDDLLHGREAFTDIHRDDVHITAIGCVGGPSMELLDYYRDELKRVNSLYEANIINIRYDLPTFHTQQEWHAARLGATRKQKLVARISMYEAAQKLVKKRWDYQQRRSSQLPSYLNGVVKFPRTLLLGADNFSKTLVTKSKQQEWQRLRAEVRKISNRLGAHEEDILWPICFNRAAAIVLENNLGLAETNSQLKPDLAAIVESNPSVL